MSKVDIAELRRLHAQGARSSHSLYVFDCIPALLDELEAAQEELRRLTQANGDLRKERDRAVAEAQRQDSVAKGLRKERDALAAYYEGEIRECKSDWLKISYHQRSTALRAAAELIRAGGWRPIAEAPSVIPPGRLGWWGTEKWYEVVTQYPTPKLNARTLGYTHYFPFDKPAPPAREVENDRG